MLLRGDDRHGFRYHLLIMRAACSYAFFSGPNTMSESAPSALRKALVATIKAAVLIAAISVLATDWLARHGPGRAGTGQLATRAGAAEPLTTGALAKAAGAKLDPCTVRPDRNR